MSGRSNKRMLLAVSFGAFILVSGIALVVALRCHVARHGVISELSQELTDGQRSETDKALALMVFIHLAEASPQDHTLAIDADVVTDLMRGIGYCDQKSNLLMQLLAEQGIGSRLLMFERHTVCEVRIDGHWAMLDPERCDMFFPVDKSSSPLGYQEFMESDIVFGIDGQLVSAGYRDSVRQDQLLKVQVMPKGAANAMKETSCRLMRGLPMDLRVCLVGDKEITVNEAIAAITSLSSHTDENSPLSAEFKQKVMAMAERKQFLAHYCRFDLMALSERFKEEEAGMSLTPASQQ